MSATFYVGDAIEVMNKLPEKSVDLVLTSPPFLALRSYLPSDHPDKASEGGSQATPGTYIDWLIDVVEACDRVLAPHGSMCIELGDTYASSGGATTEATGNIRVGGENGRPTFTPAPHIAKPGTNSRMQSGDGWPLAKSLSLIPELFRLTLVYGTNPLTGRQTERWRLRNVVRWVRPNPPVGALGDKFRPATSELMVFCKSAKRYFDLDAVRTPFSTTSPTPHVSEGDEGGWVDSAHHHGRGEAGAIRGNASAYTGRSVNTHDGAPPLDWWNIPLLEGEEPTRGGPKPKYDPEARRQQPVQARTPRWERAVDGVGGTGRKRDTFSNEGNPAGAPPLDWWNIPPGGYEGAHYAVFPPELCIKPIKAMSPERVCRVCGEPSRRITEPTGAYAQVLGKGFSDHTRDDLGRSHTARAGVGAQTERGTTKKNALRDDLGAALVRTVDTVGWSDCGHDDWRPGLVLDPFGGSGTTALVTTGHGRDCILIDLDERNYELALQRVGPFILERAS